MMTTSCRRCNRAVLHVKDRCADCWEDYAELWHEDCCAERDAERNALWGR